MACCEVQARQNIGGCADCPHVNASPHEAEIPDDNPVVDTPSHVGSRR